jgi:hypothetical protein
MPVEGEFPAEFLFAGALKAGASPVERFKCLVVLDICK